MRVSPAFVLLLLAAASCRAQFPGLPDIPGLPDNFADLINNPALAACQDVQVDQAAAEACSTESASASNPCPDSCKSVIASVGEDCLSVFQSVWEGITIPLQDGSTTNLYELLTGFCGEIAGNPTTPVPSAPAPSTSVPDTPVPDVPAVPSTTPENPEFGIEGASSNFTCDGGFSWVTLDPALASSSGDDAAEAAVALTSTCQDVNTTACCSQATGDYSYLQYGLKTPMVVRGVRVVAPDGECPDSDGFSGPCYTRLLGTSIYVTNSSVADIQDLADQQYNETLAMLAAAGTPPEDVEALRESYYWTLLLANASTGYCNSVLDYDLFGDSFDGEMANNGTINIGCGLGFLTGDVNFTIPGIPSIPGLSIPGVPSSPTTVTGGGGGAIVKDPVGSWVILSKPFASDELALCGFEVCAKPVDAAAAPSTSAAAPTPA